MTACRLFYLFNSLMGVSMISLTLTYLMQIYTAVQQRNAFGPRVFLLTGQTKDAAELLARVGSGSLRLRLRGAAAVRQLEQAAALLDAIFEGTFLRGGVPAPEPPDRETLELWRRRYQPCGARV
jgi:hypothetical protein